MEKVIIGAPVVFTTYLCYTVTIVFARDDGAVRGTAPVVEIAIAARNILEQGMMHRRIDRFLIMAVYEIAIAGAVACVQEIFWLCMSKWIAIEQTGVG